MGLLDANRDVNPQAPSSPTRPTGESLSNPPSLTVLPSAPRLPVAARHDNERETPCNSRSTTR
jgi:hypothetical protein